MTSHGGWPDLKATKSSGSFNSFSVSVLGLSIGITTNKNQTQAMENVSTRVTHILNGVSCHNISVGHPKCKANKMYPWSHLIAMSLFCPPVPWGHHQTSDKNTMSVFQSDNKGKKNQPPVAPWGTDRINHRRNKEEQEPAVPEILSPEIRE